MSGILASTSPVVRLACAEANAVLGEIDPGSVHLVNTSPRYLDLVDYAVAARAGYHAHAWRRAKHESVEDYTEEHLQTCALLYRACASVSTVCVEIDDVRVMRSKELVPLCDLWRQMLEAVGFRIAERITLVRKIAIGRRSGNFKKYRGKPGYYFPDNVTSTLLVAVKGDPQARLRQAAPVGSNIDVEWAERFLKNAWMVSPPRRRGRAGHPVPQDAEVARACITFYSLPGDTVLDPYAGSGTTGKEAIECGRSAVLIEREPGFARLIEESLPTQPEYFGTAGRHIMVPGAQLDLQLGNVIEDRFRLAFLEKSTLTSASPRMKDMARFASRACGVTIPPDLVALILRAERQILNAS